MWCFLLSKKLGFPPTGWCSAVVPSIWGPQRPSGSLAPPSYQVSPQTPLRLLWGPRHTPCAPKFWCKIWALMVLIARNRRFAPQKMQFARVSDIPRKEWWSTSSTRCLGSSFFQDLYHVSFVEQTIAGESATTYKNNDRAMVTEKPDPINLLIPRNLSCLSRRCFPNLFRWPASRWTLLLV